MRTEFSWDRVNDLVQIGNRVFDRNQGNMFVVSWSMDGKSDAMQLPDVEGTPSPRQILEMLKANARVNAIVNAIEVREGA